MTRSIQQKPDPGKNLIYREGDFLKVELRVPSGQKGEAFLRTNLFNSHKKRKEIINRLEKDIPRRYQEWGDFEMERTGDETFRIEFPLTSTGFFEAKAYFIPEKEFEPVWPGGDNLFIKVEPANSVIGNAIYSAFVRLFIGEEAVSKINNNLESQSIIKDNNFNIIPESGKFKDLISKLDFIIDELGFDIIMLLPVHPVPTTYARMGLFGSPYAALDFFSVDPALAEFDKETTPLQQFGELIDAIHAKHARIFMDIPANHTGWASQLQIHHPDYFVKNDEGKFISPGAWGVTWSDLSELDYSQKGLWEYMAEVFIFWCEKGVDGFRCDAGYMIPTEAWKYITSKVRNEYPSTIFFLEGLGGKVSTTETLLTDSNLNWAYSELFQNYDQGQIEWYLEEYKRISFSKGPLVNFSETHDNNRLASVSTQFSKLRNGLTALLSDTGTFAITCGVEWFADEKIDVHRLTSMNWGSKQNQIDYIKTLNKIIKKHPVFHSGGRLTKMHTSQLNSIAYLRETEHSGEKLAIIANLSAVENSVYLDKKLAIYFLETNIDILTNQKVNFEDNQRDLRIKLAPYQILALSNNKDFPGMLHNENIFEETQKIKAERILKRQVIQLFEAYQIKINEEIIKEKVKEFIQGPEEFFYSNFEGRPALIKWKYPQDVKRQVIVPKRTPLLVLCPNYFRYKLKSRQRTIDIGEGFYIGKNQYVSIINPRHFERKNGNIVLNLELFEEGKVLKYNAYILAASKEQLFKTKNDYKEKDILKDPLLNSVSVNKKSGISVMRGAFSELKSKYDAIISANINSEFPEDKHIMLTRFRGWTVFKGFSRGIIQEYQKSFEHYQNTTEYYFEMPAGGGMLVPLLLTFKFDESENFVNLKIKRLKTNDLPTPIGNKAIKIIIRPDIESRSHHELTKAYTGLEGKWPKQIDHDDEGFLFSDNNTTLKIIIEKGSFVREDEWQYMISRDIEKERGMDGDSDLFSPGYFKVFLKANEETMIYAKTGKKDEIESLKSIKQKFPSDIKSLPEMQNIGKVLKHSIRKFIVDRNTNKTVIAGFPWFLDWGRDTLICLRGIISAGFIEESKSIIKEFASFEKEGTLPNVIRGGDTSNRDTSDAPLWFFAAVKDIFEKKGSSFLKTDCKGRSLKIVLKSIAEHYMKGTSNGIKMDDESGLIFSPTHFTWMDTNYPAGTPREGYPIEIQALWYNAVKLLSIIYPKEKQWSQLAEKVRDSIKKYFLLRKETGDSLSKKETYLADCIHTNGFQPAAHGIMDDHIRPNQLFTITFHAIEDSEICHGILVTCEELIVPGAIRTLADRPTEYQLPVYHNGNLVNNPSRPYFGVYTGDEDSSRKPAYHNGTAWTWPFPSYCEALVKTYGESARQKTEDILSTSLKLYNEGCINQIPEILDGDFPHQQKGCYAQAWGITELYRVAKQIKMI